MIPLLKSGDLHQPMNCRGISYSSVTAKLMNKMVLMRIQRKIVNKLCPNQHGFTPCRSTNSRIQTLIRIIKSQ